MGLNDVQFIPDLFAMGEKRAAETFDMINEKFFQHQAACFVPYESDENEIVLKDFGF